MCVCVCVCIYIYIQVYTKYIKISNFTNQAKIFQIYIYLNIYIYKSVCILQLYKIKLYKCF